MSKINWKALLKISLIGAGGAILGNEDAQQAISALVPAPWGSLVTAVLGIIVLQTKPAAKDAKPTEKD